jgi:dienelactone hydrolase
MCTDQVQNVLKGTVGVHCQAVFLSACARHLTSQMCVQPAVIVAHTAIGPHDPFIQRTIAELAEAGYVAFALDMYGASDIVTGVYIWPREPAQHSVTRKSKYACLQPDYAF